MTVRTLRQYIVASPKILAGKPVFRGTRIPIYAVLELLAAGISPKEIVSDEYYPSLSLKHIRAALMFSSRLLRNEEIHTFSGSA